MVRLTDRRTLLSGVFASGAASLAGRAFAVPVPASTDTRWLANERRRVLAAAVRFRRERPVTITAFHAVRSPGGPHDYYSEGDYWWPDPAHPGGAYIRRDGFSNPGKFDDHRQALIRLSVQMPALAAAWKLTGDVGFARHAVAHLAAWFVEPATRMSPNLDHAQAIIGVNTGRGIGVIDTLHLVEVAQAARVLEQTGDAYPAPVRMGVRRWFEEYLHWLTNSANGLDESDEKNNHGSCYALQVAAFARLTGQSSLVDAQARAFRETLIPTQIAPDGRQPLELARTKPYSYSLFNLDVLATLATVASGPGQDLWHFTTPDGRGIAPALAYMAPFIASKAAWPFKPDVEYFDKLPVRQIALLFGSQALNRADYFALWYRLDPDPQTPEIIRNYPIRQPALWV